VTRGKTCGANYRDEVEVMRREEKKMREEERKEAEDRREEICKKDGVKVAECGTISVCIQRCRDKSLIEIT
jgi:hypothetical protein